MKGIENILIVKHGALGDVVRSSYMLKGLRLKYPQARIHWLTAPGALDLLRCHPCIDLLVTPEEGFELLLPVHFDLAISLDDEMEVLQRLARLDCRHIVGAHLAAGRPCYSADASEWFDMGLISHLDKEQADLLKLRNRREHNQILASMLGIEIDEALSFFPQVEAPVSFDPALFNIGLNSGAGGRWSSKQLPLEQTVSLARSLVELHFEGKPVCVWLLGGSEERQRHRAILEAVSSPMLRDAGNDNTLPQFAAIVARLDYLITSDSLALHLAISQKVRNLSFYAPTSAAEIGTFGTGVKVVSLSADYCSYRCDADNSSITADRILQALRTHLRTEGSPE